LLFRQESPEVHTWQEPAASPCMSWNPSEERAAKTVAGGGKVEYSRTQEKPLF